MDVDVRKAIRVLETHNFQGLAPKEIRKFISQCLEINHSPDNKVHIEDIKQAINIIKKFNRMKIEEIDFYEDDIKIEVPSKIFEEWKFAGMNNRDFVDMDIYKEKETIWDDAGLI